MEEKQKSIGGIWINERDGKKWLNIQVEIGDEKHKLVAFKNPYKEDNQPDYRIFVSRPKTEEAF